MKVLHQDTKFAFFASTIDEGDFAVPLRMPQEDVGSFYRRIGWKYFLRLRSVLVQGAPAHVLPTRDKSNAFDTKPRDIGTVHIVQAVHGVHMKKVGPVLIDPAEPLYEKNINGGIVFHADTDGLLTNQSLCALVVTGADCPPVLIMDPVQNAIALVHSGRKGTVSNIVGSAVQKLHLLTGTPPSKMQAVIGPGISGHNYQVSLVEYEDAWKRGWKDGVYSKKVNNEWREYLDLKKIIAMQLQNAGMDVSISALVAGSECTYDHPQTWHSYRRDTHEGLQLTRARVQLFCAMLLV